MPLAEVNNGFGELPKSRGSGATIACTIILILSGGIIYGYQPKNQKASIPVNADDLGFFCAVISSLLFGELIYALLLFTEEYKHVNSRYFGSYLKAFKACCRFQDNYMATILVFGITSFFTNKYWETSRNIMFPWSAYILVAMVNSLGFQHIAGRGFSVAEISHMNETENKNVADGLAWSYYFGYLKFMLPVLDGMVKDAVKPKFECEGRDIRDCLSSDKVFIIIPKDCYCYDSITEADKRITFIQSMPPQKITRGGVQERVYKNTLYKVQLPNKAPLFIMLEYATPLISMYDMVKETSAKFTKENLDAQVKEFYKKLQQILNSNPECRGKFELVLIKGAHEKLAEVIYKTVYESRISL